MLRLIPAPQVVFAQDVPQVLPPHEAVEGQQHLNVQPGGLFQHRLDLGPVFAHDVGVIPPGLVQIVPVEVHLVGEQRAVQGPEGAEGVRRQQELVRLVIGHQHLRPVDHRRGHKMQGVPPGAEGVPLLHHADAALVPGAKELGQHIPGGGGAHHGGLRVPGQQVPDVSGVVRLHVLHHQIVQSPASQPVGHVFQKAAAHGGVGGVEQHRFPVHQQIAVEGYAPGHVIDALEHSQAAAVGPHPGVIVIDLSCAEHQKTPLSLFYPFYYSLFPAKILCHMQHFRKKCAPPGRIFQASFRSMITWHAVRSASSTYAASSSGRVTFSG